VSSLACFSASAISALLAPDGGAAATAGAAAAGMGAATGAEETGIVGIEGGAGLPSACAFNASTAAIAWSAFPFIMAAWGIPFATAVS